MNNSEIHSLRARPRFRRIVNAQPEKLLQEFEEGLRSDEEIIGSVATHHVSVRIPNKDQHFWSPQLALELEAHEKGTLIRGLYGPKPGIWTLFVFVYATVGAFTLAMLFWGLSQNTLGQYAWALWFVPGGILTMGGVYLLTQFGQKLGYEQMEILHAFFTKRLREYEVEMEEQG